MMLMTMKPLLCISSALLLALPITAQEQSAGDAARDLERQAERAESDRTVPPVSGQAGRTETATAARFAPALLREGSYLTDIVGALKIDAQTGAWVFIPETNADDQTSTGRAPLRLLVLPSTPLEQMQRTVESTDLNVLFRLNARVYAFDGRNYILPIGAAQLDRYSEAAPANGDEAATETGDAGGANPPEGDQSATDIMQSMRESVPLPRALEGVPETNGNEAGGGGGRAMIDENTIIVNRRGRIRRNDNGAFVFIFDADSTGLADPPMTLLPCLLLERLQTQFRRGGNETTMLISGNVYAYRGRNFLLPTVYRIERDNRNINP